MASKYNSLTNVIMSIAAEENAAANIIKAESTKLQSAIDKNALPEELIELNHSVTCMIKSIGENNAQLAKKLNIAINDPDDCFDRPSNKDMQLRNKALCCVIDSVAEEEAAMAELIKAESNKIWKIICDPCSDNKNIVDINTCGACLIDKIRIVNEELANKLKTSTDAFVPVNVQNIPCDDPCDPPGYYRSIHPTPRPRYTIVSLPTGFRNCQWTVKYVQPSIFPNKKDIQ